MEICNSIKIKIKEEELVLKDEYDAEDRFTTKTEFVPVCTDNLAVKTEIKVEPSQDNDGLTSTSEQSIPSTSNRGIEFIECERYSDSAMCERRPRKTARQNWLEADMENAIAAVKGGKMGWLKASKFYKVPQSTLRRRTQGKNKMVVGAMKGLGRYRCTFDDGLERVLIDHLMDLERALFDLSCLELRKLVYQFAVKCRVAHPFNNEKKIAGRDWLRGFQSRHPEISPRQTSVHKFFLELKNVLEREEIPAQRIYNVDESGLSTLEGPNVTIVGCVSATGHYVPPAMIFPTKKWKNDLIDGAPSGTLGLAHESGKLTEETFIEWIQHFQIHVEPSPDNKVLLLLDGHVNHKAIDVLKFAKNNGIVLLCFPAHSVTQPINAGVFGSLRTYYDQVVVGWLRRKPEPIVSLDEIARLFDVAYEKAATVKNAISGFGTTGIWPISEQFLSTVASDRPVPSTCTCTCWRFCHCSPQIKSNGKDEVPT